MHMGFQRWDRLRGASAWARLTLAAKCCCYVKNPQVEQVEVVGAPHPNAPRDAWAQEPG